MWPYPNVPGKARFVLHAGWEKELWALLMSGGASVKSSLTSIVAKKKEVLDEVEFTNQAMLVDLPCVGEVSLDAPGLGLGLWYLIDRPKASTLVLQDLEIMAAGKTRFLQEEHSHQGWDVTALRQAEGLACELETARCESQDRATEVVGA